MEQKIIDKFWNNISYEALTGCWLWDGATTRSFYGVIAINGKNMYTHRLSAKIHGLDMSGDVMRHLCNTPSCCNPLHLETGSHKDNAADRVKLVKSMTLPKPLKIKRSRGRPQVRFKPETPNKRGRPRIHPLPDPNAPKRKRGRPPSPNF